MMYFNNRVFGFFLPFWVIWILYPATGLWAQTWVQRGSDIDASGGDGSFGAAISMPDTSTIAIGAFQYTTLNLFDGETKILDWNGNAWVKRGLTLIGDSAMDILGFSLSMGDANTIAIGAPQAFLSGSRIGYVRILEWNGNAWIPKGSDLLGNTDETFGWTVDMPDAHTVAVGAPAWGISTLPGLVRVYAWNGNAWIQKGADIIGATQDDQSGYSVSMPDSNTIAIGATNDAAVGPEAGHTRVYAWNGSNWVQKGIDIDGMAAGDREGSSVSMPDANTLATSAVMNGLGATNTGRTRIFVWNGSAWVQRGQDLAGLELGERMGYAVSMPDTNTVAVGGSLFDGILGGQNRGHVIVFDWDGNAWVQRWSDIQGEAPEDYLGHAICMPSDNVIGIGAPNNAGSGSGAGHARVYARANTVSVHPDLASPFRLFPNPSGDKVFLEVGSEWTLSQVTVYNAFGQQFAQPFPPKSSTIELSLPEVAGIYFVAIDPPSGKRTVLKVIRE